MISFRDEAENDISLGYLGTIYAWYKGNPIARCVQQPEMWDQWEVTIDEDPGEDNSDAGSDRLTDPVALKRAEDRWQDLKYALVSAYAANVVATRALPKALQF